MTARIEVEKTGNLEFRIRIIEKGSESSHHVTVNPDDYERLTDGKRKPEELARISH